MTTKIRRGAFTSRDEEIERLKTQLDDLRAKERLAPLFEEFHKSLGAYMGSTPIAKWPEIMQYVLNYVGNTMPTALQEYKERNKKYTR